MKKKNVKDAKNPQGKKVPHPVNTFVPMSSMPNLHNTNPIQCPPSLIEQNEPYTPMAEPFEIPAEWVEKPEEELNAELMENPDEIYADPKHSELESNLPLTFIKKENNEISWLRPDEYVTNANIDKEIKRMYPKKKYIQMREDIKAVYKESLKEAEGNEEEEEEDNNVDDFIKEDSETLKKNIYKDFYKFLQTPNVIRVVRFNERDETEEEYQKRVEEIIERQKAEVQKFKTMKSSKLLPKDKKPQPPVVQKPEEIERIKILEEDPSNIDVRNLVNNNDKISSKNGVSSIQVNSFLNWLSSIYQFILDLEIKDCVDNKNIFNNIYPQQGGVPIFNPKGHYCVKLFFMGKARRIDIDDKIPCSKDGEFIFPRCEYLNELWPALLTKALLKLNVYKVKHPFYTKYEENVDTSYIYALTGYHAEMVENLKDDAKLIDTLMNNLNDDVVLNKKKYILCLNLLDNKTSDENIYYEEAVKKMEIDTKKIQNETIDNTNNDINNNPQAGEGRVAPSRKISLSKTKSGNLLYRHLSSITEGYWRNPEGGFARSTKREKTSIIHHFSLLDAKLKVISNYAYSINDFFCNETFNMNRLKPLDFSDLKQTLKDTTVVFKQLSQQEKKEYIQQRKELKAKQLEIKNKRIEELKNEGSKFLIIKIKNNSVGQYKLNSILAYSEEDILMAKKCLLNSWKYPPPTFFDTYFKRFEDDGTAVVASPPQPKPSIKIEQNLNTIMEVNSKPASNPQLGEPQNPSSPQHPPKSPEKKPKPSPLPQKKKIGSLDWTRQAYIQLIGGDLSQYEGDPETNTIKEPIIKTSGGNWMNLSDFKSLFNTFLILHNPIAIFKGGNLSVDNNWNYYKLDIYEPLDDFAVFKLDSSTIEKQEGEVKTYSAFLIFEPNNDKTLPSRDKLYSYIIFDLYDSDHNLIENDIHLNRFYSTFRFSNLIDSKDYYLIIKGGIYQFGFFLQIFSEAHKLESMSYLNYMKSSYEYNISEFKIEHPMIEKGTYFLLGRFCIEANTNEEGIPVEEPGELKIIFNVKYNVKYVKPFIDIYLLRDDDNDSGKKVYINEEISLPQGKYYVVVSFNKPRYTLKENTIGIEVMYSNKNYKIEQIENVDFFEIKEDYVHNRHNILFKEIIYSSDRVQASLDIELTKTLINKEENNEENKEKKIKMIFNLFKLVDPTNIEVPYVDGKFSYGLRGNLIHSYEGYDNLTIPHLTFEGGLIVPEDGKKKFGSKNSNVQETPQPLFYPYLFVCYIDRDTDLKSILKQYKLTWCIKVFPSDNLGFVKDNSKEEHEKSLKNMWEENEPGRAAKAALSRKRFLLEESKNSGRELSEAELQFLQMPRERKKKNSVEQDAIAQAKSGKKLGKVQVSSKKVLPSQPQPEQAKEVPLLNVNKVLPQPKDHKSYYVRNYLTYAYKNRTIEINTINDQYKKTINTDVIQTEKNNKITETCDDFDRFAKTEMSETFYKSEPIQEILNTFYKTNTSFRSKEKNHFNDLLKHRNSLKNEFQNKITAQNNVQDVLSNYISQNYDVNYMISVYKESLPCLGKDFPLMEKLFNLISTKKEDMIKNDLKKFSAKDKNTIVKLLEDIEFNQWNISQDTKSKLKELIK